MDNGRRRYTAEQHRAWSRMAQKRTCPPPAVLRKGGEFVQKHLAICSHCQEEYDRLKLYEALASHLVRSNALTEDAPLEPGQIRNIRCEAIESLEDEGAFFSPPMVLVLSVDNMVKGLARVAQLHDEPALKAEGDVPLPPPCHDLFAEAWNTYPVFSNLLGSSLAQVPATVLAEVQKQTELPLPDVPPNSPVEAFRALEMNVGAFFSRSSVSRALDMIHPKQAGKPHSTVLDNEPQSAPVTGKIVPFPKKTRIAPIWKGMGMAACLCIMLGTLWLGGDNEQTSLSMLDTLQKLTVSGEGDAIRGATLSMPLPWEAIGVVPGISEQWKAFAAGLWQAREHIGRSGDPFPGIWSSKQGAGADSWNSHPYYDLGILAFAADMVCKTGKHPSQTAAPELSRMAANISSHIQPRGKTVDLFLEALQESPISCVTVQTNLDALDEMLRHP